MTLQKNGPAAKASAGGDEIDEIMNEIEELQQSMSASQAAPAVTRAKEEAAVSDEPNEPNVMEEFQGSSGDVSMEETLANLKDDEPSGPNLIDQAMEAEAAAAKASEEEVIAPELEEVLEEVQSELAESVEEDELLDEAEAEALDDAVAEAEEAAILAAAIEEESEEEEEVPMSEAPRRSRSSSGHPTVSVKLTGEMLLRLSYEFEGQEVLIGFADGSLKVELSDGTEFKIPVRRAPLRKAA